MQHRRHKMQPTMKLGLLAFLMLQLTATAQQQDFWNETREFVNASMVNEKGCHKLKALDWVRNYMQWHAEQLKNPSEAKYLLYLCGQPRWEGASRTANVPMPRFCSGLGDRLRGMVEMLRMAAYSNRVLLFHWSHPLKLEEVFEPTDIDWRVKQAHALDATNAPILRWDNTEPGPTSLKDGTWREQFADARLVIMRLKQRDDYGHLFKYWPHFKGGSSEERSCAYRMLFKPTALVEQRVAEQRIQLMGDAQKPYVAVHLRLGGFQGEMSDINRFDHFKGLLSALVCARSMAEASGIAGARVLLLTDNDLLRRLVAGRHFGDAVVGPSMDIPPAHLDKPAAIDSHIASFVDVVLLSRATCLLRSPSGFSNTAWYLGYNHCSNTIQKCMEAVIGQDKLTSRTAQLQPAKRSRRHTMQGRRQAGSRVGLQ